LFFFFISVILNTYNVSVTQYSFLYFWLIVFLLDFKLALYDELKSKGLLVSAVI